MNRKRLSWLGLRYYKDDELGVSNEKIAYKIPETSNCVAHTPPPAPARPAPKLFCCVSTTVHPIAESVPAAQFVPMGVPS